MGASAEAIERYTRAVIRMCEAGKERDAALDGLLESAGWREDPQPGVPTPTWSKRLDDGRVLIVERHVVLLMEDEHKIRARAMSDWGARRLDDDRPATDGDAPAPPVRPNPGG